MKANELMIEDYISIKPSGMPIKVAAVHHKKVAYHACTHKLLWVRESLLEPIPLTPEILEKNGYIKDGYFYKKGKCDRIQLGKLFEHASVVFYKDGQFREVSTTPYLLQYVHQLQHAMRLCGIEKEIIL